MNDNRVILHCDMNGFFASVELLDHPELRNVPMAVCGNPQSRHGIILAKNEPAKACGVVTAETIWQAKKKCPDLQTVPPHMNKYKAYSRKINDIYQCFTDMVEPFSIDESWLDVTGSLNLFGSGKDIADTIRNRVRNELGLTLSVGVSFNKIFAKMGSDYKKPDATTVITPENFKDLLWPLPTREMFFVGKSTAAKLEKTGIKTIGDIANADVNFLQSLLGKQGLVLWQYTNGLDDSPVALFSHREGAKSIGNGTTFKRDLTSEEDIVTALTALCDTVARRLRQSGLKAGGIKVDIKDPYFKVITRQKQLYSPTHLERDIVNASLEIIKSNWTISNPIRMLTITAINLVGDGEIEQINFFEGDQNSREKSEEMAKVMDTVRSKYGVGSIGFGNLLKNDIGASVRDSSDSDDWEDKNNHRY